MLEALDRRRGNGQQKVVVEHVKYMPAATPSSATSASLQGQGNCVNRQQPHDMGVAVLVGIRIPHQRPAEANLESRNVLSHSVDYRPGNRMGSHWKIK
jgi:hypothetical protein